MNPQQVLPGSKVSPESHALRDLEARWTLRSIALLPLPRAFLAILHAQKPAIQKTNSGFCARPWLTKHRDL